MFSYRTIFTVAFIEQIRSLHTSEYDDNSWETWVDPCEDKMPCDCIYDAFDACTEAQDPCKDKMPADDDWSETAWDDYYECQEEANPDPCKDQMPADDDWSETAWDAYYECHEAANPDPCKDDEPADDDWSETAWDDYYTCWENQPQEEGPCDSHLPADDVWDAYNACWEEETFE